VKSLIGECNLDNSDIPNEVITKINSVNAKKVADIINREKPDYIIVNGTRIISRNVLNSTNIKFINIHAGITPAYRGVHGAYWALVNREKNLAGVTVHYVNSGVDTGEIISQTTIAIDKSDCIITYPIKQLNEGLKLLSDFLKHKEIGGSFTPKLIEVNHSEQWFHPGFFQYLYHRIVYGIK
jgi:folate-dependent phosphoribosylglycinamide formyltransferase PurN